MKQIDEDMFVVSLKDSNIYENAIYKALQSGTSFSHTELYNATCKIQKCNSNTFSRYLKNLVNNGFVKHGARGTRYQLDPKIRTDQLNLVKLYKRFTSRFEEENKENFELLDLYDQLYVKTKKMMNEDHQLDLEEYFASFTVFLLGRYLLLMFVANSNNLPIALEREGTTASDHVLTMIQDLFKKLHQTDPAFHKTVTTLVLGGIEKIDLRRLIMSK